MTERTLALCIPAYNAAAFLPRLLGSAQRQRIPFDEILVYDDCSTDNTADVARSFGATVISGDVNRGCSAGKNRLLAETRCGWVHFHDADDDLLEGFTAMAHRWIDKPQAPDVVLLEYESRHAETGLLVGRNEYDRESLQRDPSLYCVRKQITNFGLYKVAPLRSAGGFDLDPQMLYNEDCRFHMRLAFAGLQFDVEPDGQVVCLERAGSMSSASRARCAVSRLHVMRQAVDEGGPRIHREIGMECWLVARHLGYYGRFDEMREAIQLAQQLDVPVPSEEPKWLVRNLARIAPSLTFGARARFVDWRDRARGTSRHSS